MRTLDKFLSKEYLRLYFVFILFLIAIFLLTDFFTSINNLKEEAKIWDIIQYYCLQIPYLFSFLSPMAVIISTLFLITHLAGTYQIQATQIAGISFKRTALPLLTIGLITGFVVIFADQTSVFEANVITEKLKQENFLGPPQKKIQKNIFIHVPPSYLFYIRSFNPEAGRMENVLVYEKSTSDIFFLAREAKWTGKEWIFYRGMRYQLNEKMEGMPFEEKTLHLDKKPSYFSRKYFPPEKMNIAELQMYISEYRKSGFKTLDLETELNFKISYPFTNFILLFLGIPVGLVLRKGGRGASLALGLLISFAYYETMALLKSLGENGIVSPFLAAWTPNLIFLVGGVYLLTRVE
jgi:lipopolysaccharide export system permease protein